MPAPTNVTDLNITTSAAKFLADSFTSAGWAIYWQATDTLSGTATQGEITIVPEFPSEPSLLVFSGTRQSDQILLPAFAVQIVREPTEDFRAGMGEDLFLQRGRIGIEGFVRSAGQHMAFATLFRNWFREETDLILFDFETDPVSPAVVDVEITMTNRSLDRVEFLDSDAPPQMRYYLNLEMDIVYFD